MGEGVYPVWAVLGRGRVTGGGSDPVWGSEFPGLTTKASSPRLQQQYPAYSGVARLAKRWVRAQLLGEGFTDESLDLLAASLFLHPEPFTPPR